MCGLLCWVGGSGSVSQQATKSVGLSHLRKAHSRRLHQIPIICAKAQGVTSLSQLLILFLELIRRSLSALTMALSFFPALPAAACFAGACLPLPLPLPALLAAAGGAELLFARITACDCTGAVRLGTWGGIWGWISTSSSPLSLSSAPSSPVSICGWCVSIPKFAPARAAGGL